MVLFINAVMQTNPWSCVREYKTTAKLEYLYIYHTIGDGRRHIDIGE